MTKKLMTVKWENLQIGDEFPESGAVVQEIFPWQESPCYELITTTVDSDGFEEIQTMIASEDHLIAVETFNTFSGKDFETTKRSKAQTHKQAENWIAVKDAFNFFMQENNISIAPGLNGVKIEIRPYHDLKPQQVRCITTNQGTFTVNGILFGNSARGEHDITAMKDIVADLCRSGLSEQWIARNLFLEPEAISRFKQLAGLKSAFADETAFESMAWDPIAYGCEDRRKNISQTQAAVRYVRAYRRLQGLDTHFDQATDVVAAAKNLGWDPENPNEIPISLDENGKVYEKEIAGDASDEDVTDSIGEYDIDELKAKEAKAKEEEQQRFKIKKNNETMKTTNESTVNEKEIVEEIENTTSGVVEVAEENNSDTKIKAETTKTEVKSEGNTEVNMDNETSDMFNEILNMDDEF